MPMAMMRTEALQESEHASRRKLTSVTATRTGISDTRNTGIGRISNTRTQAFVVTIVGLVQLVCLRLAASTRCHLVCLGKEFPTVRGDLPCL